MLADKAKQAAATSIVNLLLATFLIARYLYAKLLFKILSNIWLLIEVSAGKISR